MVLVFILYTIIIIITILICMVLLSTIRIQIDNFEIGNIVVNSYFPNIYKINFSVYFMNKIKWFSVTLDRKKVKKIYTKFKMDNIDLRKIEKELKIEDFKQIKRLNPKFVYFNLQTKIGLENVILTSFVIFFISTVISIVLPYMIDKYDKSKYKYNILPVYINKNVYEIKLDCITEIKVVHIINILYYFVKKRREKNHEQRTSNRRSYGYSYE